MSYFIENQTLVLLGSSGLLLCFVIVLVKDLVVQGRLIRDRESNISDLEKIKVEQSEENESLRKTIEPLLKYQQITDVEAAVSALRKEADAYVSQQEHVAKTVVSEATEEAQRLRSDARVYVKKQEIKASETIRLATEQANEILEVAQSKAEELAGDSLKAMANAEEYSKTERAMRNLIKGYGDEYLVPNRSAIDELAEDYDHTKAGRELAEARAKTKAMIKHNTAADCDYVEEYRRRTAIEFVLDAFNGKVDSILTKVKHDNYGKLQEQIKDAFQTVNHNGSAFRSARINELYLASRLNELKWAVATNELKLQEREEQRQIREQIREEERARREYQKAIKEAEREERTLQKALDIARKELAAANDAERATLESELLELTDKLREAEARGERALSMAQQTKRGHVYVISNEGSFGAEVFKIGLTRRLEPLDRIKELGDASVPFPFDVHAVISADDAPALERELHQRFDDARMNKVNQRKEFFKVALSDVKRVIEAMGIECHWTMAAEAIEYRESRAMSRKHLSLVESKSIVTE